MKESTKILSTIVFLGFILYVYSASAGQSLITLDAVPKNGETVWVAQGDNVTVTYQEEDCGYLSKNVIQNIVDDSGAGVFPWKNMENKEFRDKTLATECDRLKKEMERRAK